MKFWTSQQYPVNQAIHYNGSEIDIKIPNHSPKTPARQVVCVGSYNDYLLIVRRASIEFWTKDGSKLIRNLYNPLFYYVHAAVQYGDNIIISSCGIDLIMMINFNGKVLWEWWGYKNGLCLKPDFMDKDWQNKQFNTDNIAVSDSLHLNSIYVAGKFLHTCALKRNKIYCIPIGSQGYEEVHSNTVEGCHSAIPVNRSFIYGHKRGIKHNDVKVVTDCTWVKTIKKVENGYMYTHDKGVTLVDNEWNKLETVNLYAPFALAFYA